MNTKTKPKSALASAGAIVFWVGVWYILALAINPNLMFKIPTPADTVIAFFGNLGKSAFWAAAATSLWHICSGFVIACVLGLILGMLSGSLPIFKTFTLPLVHLIRSIPVAAFVVLAWLWIPNSFLPTVIAAITVLPIVWSAVEEATIETDKKLLEMAKVMRLSKIKTIIHIRFFGILPTYRAAVISGLGYAWRSGVAAEIICNPTGSIGTLLSGAKQDIDYPQVFAVTLTIVLLSLIIEKLIKLVWREKRYD